jgi:hypothetical protein
MAFGFVHTRHLGNIVDVLETNQKS